MAQNTKIDWCDHTVNLWLFLFIFVFLNINVMAQTKEGAIIVSANKRGLSVDEYKLKVKTEKWCSLGKHWNSRKKFVRDNSRHDGLATKCKDCTRSKKPYVSLKGRVSTFKGKKHSEKSKLKMSLANKGKPSPMKGKSHTKETKQKISKILREKSKKGKESHSYIDGKLIERKGIRFSREYKNWRYDVFLRDGFTCQKCGDDKGGNLEAHHIKSFSKYPKLRFIINNGITYCKDCHKLEHNEK